jgi:hypothetical protein
MEVHIRLHRFKTLSISYTYRSYHIHVMHELKELDKEKEFSVADGLHTSFERVHMF